VTINLGQRHHDCRKCGLHFVDDCGTTKYCVSCRVAEKVRKAKIRIARWKAKNRGVTTGARGHRDAAAGIQPDRENLKSMANAKPKPTKGKATTAKAKTMAAAAGGGKTTKAAKTTAKPPAKGKKGC